MTNFPARNVAYLVLFSIGAAIVLLVAFLLVRRRIAFLKIRNSPLTPAEAFRKYKPPVQSMEASGPRLTFSGRWAVVLAALFGSIWIGVTLATLHSFLMDYRFASEAQTATAMVSKSRPAGERPLNIFQGLLPCALLALIAFVPARQLRRDLVLARIGRPTTGVVVGVLSGRSSYSILVYYDFAGDQGGVTRGNASLRGEYWQAVAGSPIQVLYLPDNPAHNNLKLAMYWQ